jgi:NitT/TauT family transport system ATP-binding protein
MRAEADRIGDAMTSTEKALPPQRGQAQVMFDGIDVAYGTGRSGSIVHALAAIDLTIGAGEFVSLIGPSGCGKSTLLRVASDIIKARAGTCTIGGQSPRAARLNREIGFVFQDSALLEWRDVLQNVALPLDIEHVGRRERESRARDLIAMVGLKGFENAYPRQLSGGMRQRAAIARAMSTAPKLLLMDEPFGALDQITRDRLNLELLELSQRERMTVLFVTHSIREAILLSDRVVVMTPRPGRIKRIIDIDLPRPRELAVRDSATFQSLARLGVAELEQGYETHDTAH